MACVVGCFEDGDQYGELFGARIRSRNRAIGGGGGKVILREGDRG